MKITNLVDDEDAVRQVASLLVEGFKESGATSWLTMADAIADVRESFDPDRISRIWLNEQNQILGWLGGIGQYDGEAWELHPLVVSVSHQGRGIGRALVTDFEEQVKLRGGATIWLGTDDENNRTSLGGVDLYPDVLTHLSNIRNLRRHPYEFYLKLGYAITGVIPDANGFGKPDIFMAKRVS